MAIITNTATRYSVNGIREDFSDIIYNISPETTPFISNMTKRRKATNTIFEWQIDSLASAASNAQIDGDDLSSFTAITATTKLSNVTMISRKDAVVADNLNGAVDQAGMRSQLAYQITKKGNELKRDMEYNLVGVNVAAVSGAAGTARKTASLSAWLTSNVSRGTGGASGTLSNGMPNAAATDASAGNMRAATEVLMKPVLQSMWSNGGDPRFIMVGPFNKGAVSAFAGIAAQRYMAPSDSPTTIIGAADVYMSDFGSVQIVPNRFSRERDMYMIDPDMVELVTLRPMAVTELAKTGDASKFMTLVEYGLQVNNEAGLGVLADLTTS
tara:strand:+ start:1546 stop:2526 length:981 start_codon:yes stop_codon:yes gene_type:complete